MKRKIISWLLAIACCLSLLPGNLVIAEEIGEKNLPVTTVAYFTNLASCPQSDAYAQAVTVTGSAFIDIGGKTRWDYGLIIIEPKEGYTFDKAWYPSNGYQQNEYTENNSKKFEISDVKTVLQELGTVEANRPYIINEAVKGKDNYIAIKIDSVLFNNIINKTICIDFLQESSGNIISQRFHINSNEPWLETKEVTTETQFDLFDYDIFKGNDLKREDFTIDSSKYVGFTNLPIENILEKDDKVVGKYRIPEIGTYGFILNNNKNGMRYFVDVNVTDKDAPLKEGSITVSDHAVINYDNISCGMMTVQPENKQDFLMKNIDFSFNLPEGAVIDWTSTKINNLPKELEVNKEEEPFTISVWTGEVSENVNIYPYVTEENGKQKLSISARGTDGEQCGLKIYITFDIHYMNKKYNYTISFVPNHYVGFMGGRTYFIQPHDERDIFDLLSVYGSNEDEIEQNKQRFFDNIDKSYSLTISGVTSNSLLQLSRENPNVHFSSSGNKGLYIYDKNLKTLVNGWSLQVVMQTYIEAEYEKLEDYEDFVKLEDYEDYFENVPYTVECNGDVEYNSEKSSIYPKTENAEGVVDIRQKSDNRLLAELAIHFAPKDNREENLKKAMVNMPKEGGKAVFFSMENDVRAEISADVLNILMQSTSAVKDGKGNRLVIMLKSSSGNKVEWDFNSATMKNIAKKNIVLNVQVGNGVENINIDKVLEEMQETGLKVGFWDNGELPGETQIRLYLSDEEAKLLERNTYEKAKIFEEDINTIYLYYYNPNTQKLVKERNNLYIDSTPNNKKYISIPITHNSDFVLSTASDLDKNTSNSSGTISGGGISVVYTPSPTTAPTVTPVATPTVAPTIVPTAIPTATSIPVPTTAPVATSTPEPAATPVAIPTTVPSETETPDATPTVVPSDKNKVKKVKAVKKKVTIEKNKKLDVNFKVTATNNKKAVQDKVKATIKNKKIAKVVKTKVKAGKAVVTVKGRKKGKTVLKLNIGGKTAKTTIKVK